MSSPSQPWTESGYADILSATRSGEEIEITFGNGDLITVPATLLGITDDDFQLEVDPDEALSIRILDGSEQDQEISWTQIRAMTDPAFAQEMRRRDAEEAGRVGLRLKALREDRNLSQRDLAHLVGMSAPQLSKIESGAFDLRLSTVRSLLRALGADFSDIGADAPEASQRALRRTAERAGVPRDLLDRLLERLPRRAVPSALARAFNWRVEALLEGSVQNQPIALNVAFKTLRSSPPGDSPLVWFAYELSALVRHASDLPSFRGVPSSPSDIRKSAADTDGQVTLESLLRWAWSSGICVLPLHGKKDFAAAVWTIDDAPVILLKDTRDLAVYWLFDLAHELGHVVSGHVHSSGIVEVDAPSPRTSEDQLEEQASSVALEILLPNHRELLKEVRSRARGSHLRFKGAVASTAAEVGISAGLLGMVAAYELTEVGEDKDRWGSATNLARPDGTGRAKTQVIAKEYLRREQFSEFDALLLEAAVFAE